MLKKEEAGQMRLQDFTGKVCLQVYEKWSPAEYKMQSTRVEM